MIDNIDDLDNLQLAAAVLRMDEADEVHLELAARLLEAFDELQRMTTEVMVIQEADAPVG